MFFRKKSRVVYPVLLLMLGFCFLPKLQATDIENKENEEKVKIVGCGFAGLMKAYFAWKKARDNGEVVKIVVFEKLPEEKWEKGTTAANVWHSHTPAEIVHVVPDGSELIQRLKIPFDRPGGLRVTDVSGVNVSEFTKRFTNSVKASSRNEGRTPKKVLLELGKASMILWKKFYGAADSALRSILETSNFNPCDTGEYEEGGEKRLPEGHRINLFYGSEKAKDMGLSPVEVMGIDPTLTNFCINHSVDNPGQRRWKKGNAAILCPAGCLDTQTFLPMFLDYLENKGLKVKFNKEVTGVTFDNEDGNLRINGLKFLDGTQSKKSSGHVTYVFCPGEAVGTLHKLGFSEPPSAGFAGCSLSFTIPFPTGDQELDEEFKELNHCMEIRAGKLPLAWQARIREVRNGNGNEIFIGTAGGKAYYGNIKPTIHDDFSKTTHLSQLRAINDIFPQIVSFVLKRDTTGKKLKEKDMPALEKAGIVRRWVGTRAVAYDGFPTLGCMYYKGGRILNAELITHLSSGGGAFAPIAVLLSNFFLNTKEFLKELKELGLDQGFIEEALPYFDSRRGDKGSILYSKL